MSTINRNHWADQIAAIREHAEVTDDMAEVIRRVGAQRRHEARVREARLAFDALVDRAIGDRSDRPHWTEQVHEIDRVAVRSWVARAIRRACDAVGMPGSASGGPSPWTAGNNSAGARIAAWREATMEHAGDPPSARAVHDAGAGIWHRAWLVHGPSGGYRTTHDPGDQPGHFLGEDGGLLVLYRDCEDTVEVAAWDYNRQPVLVEHLIRLAVEPMARAVDAWDGTGPLPALPPDDLCRTLIRCSDLLAARRSRGETTAGESE